MAQRYEIQYYPEDDDTGLPMGGIVVPPSRPGTTLAGIAGGGLAGSALGTSIGRVLAKKLRMRSVLPMSLGGGLLGALAGSAIGDHLAGDDRVYRVQNLQGGATEEEVLDVARMHGLDAGPGPHSPWTFQSTYGYRPSGITIK